MVDSALYPSEVDKKQPVSAKWRRRLGKCKCQGKGKCNLLLKWKHKVSLERKKSEQKEDINLKLH